MFITSAQNELIKKVSSYKDGKGEFVILDTDKLILDSFNNGAEFVYLFSTEKNINKFVNINCEKILTTDTIIKKISTSTSSQGSVGVVKFDTKKITLPQNSFLILDNIQDPGNIGTILRTALGADYKDIYCINCANVRSSKVIRSSMGSIFSLNIYQTNLYEFIDFSKKINLPIIAADMNGDCVFDCQVKGKCGIILGNEGNGICNELRQIATKFISIPMNNNLESLNVAVSGAIIMYSLKYLNKE